MRYTLSIDGRLVGPGSLRVNKNGQAWFFAGDGEDGDLLRAAMEGARLEKASTNGLTLVGREPGGRKRNGEVNLRPVTWWLAYENGGSSVGALASVCQELVDAMRAYEMDVDTRPPYSHREMMDRAMMVLHENGGGA